MMAMKKVLLRTPRFVVCSATHVVDGRRRQFYYVEKPDAVIVLAHDGEGVALLKAARPLVRRRSLELPGGRIEAGESPLAAARRELAEECGLAGKRWRRLGTIYSLPSVATERAHIFSAEVEFPRGRWHTRSDSEGIHHVRVHSFEKARLVAATGALQCAGDAYALLLFLDSRRAMIRRP